MSYVVERFNSRNANEYNMVEVYAKPVEYGMDIEARINVRQQFTIPVFTYRITRNALVKSIELMEREYNYR